MNQVRRYFFVAYKYEQKGIIGKQYYGKGNYTISTLRYPSKTEVTKYQGND
jgi:hypothetical protein